MIVLTINERSMTNNALEIENNELKKQLEFMQKKCYQQEQAYTQLLQSFKEAQRNRFGARSEKFIDLNVQQLDLFVKKKLPLPSSNTAEISKNNIVDIKPYQRRKKNHRQISESLPHREVIIPVENKFCDCGTEKTVIRHETTELFHYQPPVYEVIVQKREVVVCPKACIQSMATAPNPKRILPKTNVTPHLLAHVVVSKLHDRQPHYHFEKKLIETVGFQCRRNKLSRWFIESGFAVQPLINLSKDIIRYHDVAFCDPTSLQVLREPGRNPTTSSYAFCIRGGPADQGAVIYEYNASEHKLFLNDWFAEFCGYLHVDAQNIYDDLESTGRIKLVYCNTHARRKFEAITKQVKAQDGLSHDAMHFYQKIYRIEREAKQLNLTSGGKKEFRIARMQPLFDKFYEWLNTESPTTLRQSPLGVAFNYALKHWDGLVRFFEDGRLEIDNNSTEQLIKYLVMTRKAFLFSTSIEGAKALCNHLSLIRTAVMHRLDPYSYYVKIFESLPYCNSVEDYEALLPWNIDLPRVKILKVA
jgi:transposase